MSDRFQRCMAMAIGAALVATLSATPVLGQSGDDVQVAAASGNASKVDGKSAVGFDASVATRSGKLVATSSSTGLLPSNILEPLWSMLQGIPAAFADGQITWAEVTGKPAGFADDVDNGAFVSSAGAAIFIGPGLTLYPSVYNLNRNISVEFEIVPTSAGVFLTQDRTWVYMNADTTVNHFVQVTNQSGALGATFRVRLKLYSDGIALAALKKQAKAIKIVVKKRLPK